MASTALEQSQLRCKLTWTHSNKHETGKCLFVAAQPSGQIEHSRNSERPIGYMVAT